MLAESEGVTVSDVVRSTGDEDAVVALMTLGFTRSESEKAISRAKSRGATEIEDIIRIALQGM